MWRSAAFLVTVFVIVLLVASTVTLRMLLDVQIDSTGSDSVLIAISRKGAQIEKAVSGQTMAETSPVATVNAASPTPLAAAVVTVRRQVKQLPATERIAQAQSFKVDLEQPVQSEVAIQPTIALTVTEVPFITDTPAQVVQPPPAATETPAIVQSAPTATAEPQPTSLPPTPTPVEAPSTVAAPLATELPTAAATAVTLLADSLEIKPTVAPTQPQQRAPAAEQERTGTKVVGDGSAASCTAAALAQAIAEASLVRFNCGSQPVTISLTQPLHVVHPVEIDGGNMVTLDGGRRSALIETEQRVTLTVRNLTFVNGVTSGQGGAIGLGFWSNLNVYNSTFRNNHALKQSAACDGGGAIFVGGGSTAHIEQSVFESNSAQNGGAINVLRSGITIINSRFSDNHALHSDAINQFGDCGGGGAVYVDATRKPEDGGPDAIILRGNSFNGNSTNNHGGALFIAVHSGEQVEIGTSYFENNKVLLSRSMPTSGTGGAIWYGKAIGSSVNNSLTLYNSVFVNNHADTQGGAVWTSLPISVRNSSFSGNQALNPTQLPADDWRKGNGGAIAVAHQVLVIIESSTFVANRAGFNGGAVVGENIAARNTIFVDNVGDWHMGLQQNCTHALQDWGGNIQFLADHPQPDHRHWSGCGSSIEQADPLLEAQGAGRFMPRHDSPAVDGGVSDGCPTIDLRGVSRPSGAGCDSGAIEREQ